MTVIETYLFVGVHRCLRGLLLFPCQYDMYLIGCYFNPCFYKFVFYFWFRGYNVFLRVNLCRSGAGGSCLWLLRSFYMPFKKMPDYPCLHMSACGCNMHRVWACGVGTRRTIVSLFLVWHVVVWRWPVWASGVLPTAWHWNLSLPLVQPHGPVYMPAVQDLLLWWTRERCYKHSQERRGNETLATSFALLSNRNCILVLFFYVWWKDSLGCLVCAQVFHTHVESVCTYSQWNLRCPVVLQFSN